MIVNMINMKTYIIFSFFIFFQLIGLESFATENVQTRTDSALIYYSNSNYEKALEIYLSFVDDNYLSSELYYNIGNCYYKLDKITESILWYERALIHNPSNENIIKNLEIANSRTETVVEKIPDIFYISWYNTIANSFNSNNWAWISLAFFVSTLFFLILFLFARTIGLKKSAFIISIFTVFLFLLSINLSLSQKNKELNNPYAIVFEYSLAKSSPNDDSSNLFEIHKGIKVEVLQELNDWTNIKLADGKQAWIKQKNIVKITPNEK
jgi:tetratricopeptide (TPR) repeat protein